MVRTQAKDTSIGSSVKFGMGTASQVLWAGSRWRRMVWGHGPNRRLHLIVHGLQASPLGRPGRREPATIFFVLRGRMSEIDRTGHAIDHPIRFPEGAYLKCLFATAP